jgi:arginase
MPNRGTGKTVRIIGVPMDLGAGRRGVDLSPSALRIGGIHSVLVEINIKVEDGNDVQVKTPEAADRGELKQVFLNEITSVCKTLADLVAEILEQEKFPLILGGGIILWRPEVLPEFLLFSGIKIRRST